MLRCLPLWNTCNQHVDYVDKRHCNLFSVPDEILRHTQTLEELLLDANQISELPRGFFRLMQLKRLTLSDNEICRLPPDIANLMNLQELDISRNDIEDIPENIKYCKNLQLADFSSNPLQRLPDGFTHLKNLTHLALNDVSLTRLPTDIGSLSSLESLELRENLIKYLPPSISMLSRLRTLDLGSNLIEELPEYIGTLPSLEELWLDSNEIVELPLEMGNLRSLTQLDVSENKLEQLPEEIGGLVGLTDLILSQNQLQFLPDGIGNLRRLTILKVDQNQLLQLTPNLGKCELLEELLLTENLLAELPNTIGRLVSLRIFNVDRNQLTDIPRELTAVMLRQLHPKHQATLMIPQGIEFGSKSPAGTKRAAIRRRGIRRWPPHKMGNRLLTLGNCVHMGVLSLRDNRILKLPLELGNMRDLHVLDVCGNRLQYLPITLSSCNLKAIWLSENQVQPLLKFQQDVDEATGMKVLTCFLLPQQAFKAEYNNSCTDPLMRDYGGSSGGGGGELNRVGGQCNNLSGAGMDDMWNHDGGTTVKFAGEESDRTTAEESHFVRHNTPHPRELKARHGRSGKKEGPMGEVEMPEPQNRVMCPGKQNSEDQMIQHDSQAGSRDLLSLSVDSHSSPSSDNSAASNQKSPNTGQDQENNQRSPVSQSYARPSSTCGIPIQSPGSYTRVDQPNRYHSESRSQYHEQMDIGQDYIAPTTQNAVMAGLVGSSITQSYEETWSIDQDQVNNPEPAPPASSPPNPSEPHVERRVGFAVSGAGRADPSQAGPEGGEELEDDSPDRRLHRRDTPHHLKNKRINSPSSTGGGRNSSGDSSLDAGEEKVRHILSRGEIEAAPLIPVSDWNQLRASGRNRGSKSSAAGTAESFESWASEISEPTEVDYARSLADQDKELPPPPSQEELDIDVSSSTRPHPNNTSCSQSSASRLRNSFRESSLKRRRGHATGESQTLDKTLDGNSKRGNSRAANEDGSSAKARIEDIDYLPSNLPPDPDDDRGSQSEGEEERESQSNYRMEYPQREIPDVGGIPQGISSSLEFPFQETEDYPQLKLYNFPQEALGIPLGGVSLSHEYSDDVAAGVELMREQRLEIHISREPSTPLGMSIAGGVGTAPPPGRSEGIYVTRIAPDGLSDRAGLKPGDRIDYINGTSTEGMDHHSVVRLLKDAGEVVCMGITRLLVACIGSEADDQILTARLYRDENGLGFTIAGGRGSTPYRGTDQSIYISRITEGGAAEREGTIRVADRLLSVNGVDVSSAEHDEAVRLLTSISGEVVLEVSRDLDLATVRPLIDPTDTRLAQSNSSGKIGSVTSTNDSNPVVDNSAYVDPVNEMGTLQGCSMGCVDETDSQRNTALNPTTSDEVTMAAGYCSDRLHDENLNQTVGYVSQTVVDQNRNCAAVGQCGSSDNCSIFAPSTTLNYVDNCSTVSHESKPCSDLLHDKAVELVTSVLASPQVGQVITEVCIDQSSSKENELLEASDNPGPINVESINNLETKHFDHNISIQDAQSGNTQSHMDEGETQNSLDTQGPVLVKEQKPIFKNTSQKSSQFNDLVEIASTGDLASHNFAAACAESVEQLSEAEFPGIAEQGCSDEEEAATLIASAVITAAKIAAAQAAGVNTTAGLEENKQTAAAEHEAIAADRAATAIVKHVLEAVTSSQNITTASNVESSQIVCNSISHHSSQDRGYDEACGLPQPSAPQTDGWRPAGAVGVHRAFSKEDQRRLYQQYSLSREEFNVMDLEEKDDLQTAQEQSQSERLRETARVVEQLISQDILRNFTPV